MAVAAYMPWLVVRLSRVMLPTGTVALPKTFADAYLMYGWSINRLAGDKSRSSSTQLVNGYCLREEGQSARSYFVLGRL